MHGKFNLAAWINHARVDKGASLLQGWLIGLCYISTMLVETADPTVRVVQPRTFTGLMTLYASNYASLRQLLGDLRRLPALLISESSTDLHIHLSLQERSPYTTSLHMTYWLNSNGHLVAHPDLKLRIYHDARLAEATACRDQSPRAFSNSLSPSPASELLRRWTLNILLRKWLEHCLDHHHRFVPVSAQPIYRFVERLAH